MDARRDGASRIGHGNAPEIAQAEGKRPGLRDGGVVEVVAVFFEVFAEVFVVLPAEDLEKFSAGFGDVDAALGLVVAQSFG